MAEQRNHVGQVTGLVSEGGLQEVDRLLQLPVYYREEDERKRQEHDAAKAAEAEASVSPADDGF